MKGQPETHNRFIMLIMSHNSDLSTFILPSEQQVQDHCSIQPKSTLKSTRPARCSKLVVGGISTVLLVGMFCLLYFVLDSPRSSETEREIRQSVGFVGNHQLIIDSDQVYSRGEMQFSDVREIILRDPHVKSFDTTPFPSLQSLVIEPYVKLENLVVNNSQLTEFIYSSSDLKTLKLINNTKLVTFLNSTIPSLTHLYVTKTPIISFFNNRLESLIHLQFTDSAIQKLHLTYSNIKTLILTNCGSISTYPDSFSQYQNLQSLKIDRCQFLYVSEFENMGELRSIVSTASNFQDGIHIFHCHKLEQLNIEGEYIKSIILRDLPSLYLFFPTIDNIQIISLVNTSIHEFIIDTDELVRLEIGGTATRKVQSNIPGLKQLLITNSSISDSQFTGLQLPHLDALSIHSCARLNWLSNSFPKLLRLEFVDQFLLDFASLDAPILQALIIDYGKYSGIDTTPFSHLRDVMITQAKVNGLTISDSVAYLVLHHIDNQPEISLKAASLQRLDIQGFNNLVLQNQDFPSLQLLKVSGCTNISILNNTFTPNLTSFLIDYNHGDLILSNNTFDFDPQIENITVAIQNNELKELEQQFTGFKQILIRRNHLEDLEATLKMLPDMEYVVAQANMFEKIVNLTNQVVSVLNLAESNKLISFEDNQFLNLTQLDLSYSSNLTNFSNNTFPKLHTLHIQHCPGLADEDILQELSLWAERETNLTILAIDNRGEEFDEKVKEIFPDVDIWTT